MAEIFKTFMAEAEKMDPKGFAKARGERAEMDALRKDAERYRKLLGKAQKKTAYDVYGDGCMWSLSFFCGDSNLPFDAAVDALP